MSEADLHRLENDFYRALNERDQPALEKVGLEIAAQATEDPPLLYSLLNATAYHNRLLLLNRMMATAWPLLHENRGYSRPAVEAFAARATDHLIYAFIEQQGQTEKSIEDLIAQLELYFPVEEERLRPYMIILSGEKGRPWTMADFDPLQMGPLSGLTVEFLGYAHRVQIPFATAHLLREIMPRYLLDRQAGNLQPKPDMASALSRGARPFPHIPPEPLHPLAPDQPSLSLFLTRLLQTADPQTHVAAAFLKLTPTWLDFLHFRDLLSEQVAAQSKTFLASLQNSLSAYWTDHPDRQIRALA